MTARVCFNNDRMQIEGNVSFDNADRICQEGLKILASCRQEAVVDLSHVEGGGSILVAVLLQWLRASLKEGKRLRFEGLADKLQSIIRVSGLKELITTS